MTQWEEFNSIFNPFYAPYTLADVIGRTWDRWFPSSSPSQSSGSTVKHLIGGKPFVVGGGQCPGDPGCPGNVVPSPRSLKPTEPSPGSTYYEDFPPTRKNGKCETGFFYSGCEVDYMKVAVVVVGAVAFITMFSKRKIPSLTGEQQYIWR